MTFSPCLVHRGCQAFTVDITRKARDIAFISWQDACADADATAPVLAIALGSLALLEHWRLNAASQTAIHTRGDSQ